MRRWAQICRLHPFRRRNACHLPSTRILNVKHFVSALSVLLLIAGCGDNTTSEAKTPAELLAQIDFEVDSKPYNDRLDSLENKCEAPTRMKIADNVAGAVQVLDDNGRKEKALDIMDGMIEAIPEGSEGKVECSDIATGLVTIMVGGSVDATPKP